MTASRRSQLGVKVRAVHAKSRGTYGIPRAHRELRTQGEIVSEKAVAKAMRTEGIAGKRRRPFRATTDSRKTQRIAPNLPARDFSARAPNEAWVTDATAVVTRRGWVSPAAILDPFSGSVVGWAVSESNDTRWLRRPSRRRWMRATLFRAACTTRTAGAPTALTTTSPSSTLAASSRA